MDIEYKYKAIDSEGKEVKGVRNVSDEFTLQKDLKKENLDLVYAEPVGKFSFQNVLKKVNSIGTIKTQDKINFFKNLSSMLNSGLSLTRALQVISRQTKNKKVKSIFDDLIAKINKGSGLSVVMQEHKAIFSPLMISMVKAGEESGNLVKSLDVVGGQLDKQNKLNKKIKGAMIYPSVIVFAMGVVGAFMLLYIVPTLTKTFTELNVDLPASTQFIINLSDFLSNNIVLALAIILIIFSGLFFASKTRIGKRGIHWFILRLPTIGVIVKETNSARTARTLSSLLSSGVSYVRSLQITEEVIQNVYFKDVLKEAEKNIQLGLPISSVFSKAEKLYPPFVAEMISVGEETGDLGTMLTNVADFYENEVDQKTKNISTIIEPVLMLVVGGAVGFFAISMISPMYSLVETI